MPTRIRQVSYTSPGPNGETSLALSHGGSIPADTTIVAVVAFTGKPNIGIGEPSIPSVSSTGGISWSNLNYIDSIDGAGGGAASSTLQVVVYYAHVASIVAADTTTWTPSFVPCGPAAYSATYYSGNHLIAELPNTGGARGNGVTATTNAFTIPGGMISDAALIAIFSGQASVPTGTPALATGSLGSGARTTLTNGGAAPNIQIGWEVWEANAGPYSGAQASQSAGVSTGQWIARVIGIGFHVGGTAYTAALGETVVASEALVAGAHFHPALSETASPPLGESISGSFTGSPLPQRVADIRLVWNDGTIDATIVDDDIGSDPGLRTAVALSLFCDRRAEPDDVIPAGDGDRRGWWGDEFSAVENDRIGSRLWLLDRAAKRPDVVRLGEEYVREALAWMLADRVATRLDVEVETRGAGIFYAVGIVRPQGNVIRFRFAHVWDAVAAEAE